MATPGEKKSWRSGRKGSQKKKAQPKVLGLSLALGALAVVLLWAIWPRPMAQVHLFVVSAEEMKPAENERVPRYETARVDTEAVLSIFSELAEQVQSVASASEWTVAKLKASRPEDFKCQGGIGIVFLNAFSRVQVGDDQTGTLQFEFGTDRQVLSFADLVQKFHDTGLRELILLLEVSHELPGLESGLLANEGTGLLKEEVEKFTESHPELKLTVLSSTQPLHFSYPHVVKAKDLPDLKDFSADREVIQGTAFGHAVAEVFREGDFWTISDLEQRITDKVNKTVTDHFRSEQTPQLYATYLPPPESPVKIFQEHHSVVKKVVAAAADEEAPAEEAPPAKAESGADEIRKSPDEKLIAYRRQVADLLESSARTTVTISDWQRLNAIESDLKYVLDHGNLRTFESLLSQGERFVLQLQSGAGTASQFDSLEEIRRWVSPAKPLADLDSSFFSEVLAEVNDGENSRNTKLVELLKSQESRERLSAAFLATCENLLDELSNASPEAVMQRVEFIAELKTFFERLTRKSTWGEFDWPHQFLVAADLLRNANFEWTDTHVAAFARLQILRSQAVQIAAGWGRDGTHRLDQRTYEQIKSQLSEVLNSVLAAERWFLLGPRGAGLVEQHLLQGEVVFTDLSRVLENEHENHQFLTQHRLKIFEAVEPVALLHDTVVLTSEQLTNLSQLPIEELEKFSPTHFPQASFSQLMSRDDAIALLQLTTRLETQSPRSQINETLSAMNRFREPAEVSLVVSPTKEIPQQAVHQGIWLSFWSIRSLQALGDQVDQAELLKVWKELVEGHAGGAKTSVLASLRVRLARKLADQWGVVSRDPVVLFKPVPGEQVQELLSADLLWHARLAGGEYPRRYRKLFEAPSTGTALVSLRLPGQDLKVENGQCELDLDIPEGAQVYFFPDDVRLQNPEFQDIQGWQVGPWNRSQRSLRTMSTFSGNAQPTIAIVNDFGIVQVAERLKIGVAFQVTGWNVRFQSQGVRMDELDISDTEKILKLPPLTGEAPMPVSVQLLQPKSSFAKSVLINIAPLNELGEPGKPFWSKFQEIALDATTRSAEIPLFPVAQEGDPNPALPPASGFDLTQGFAFIVRPKEESSREVEVVLKVSLRFLNPVDSYIQLSEPTFDSQQNKLLVPIRRRSAIPASSFAPKKIGAELNYSRDLDQYKSTPPPKRPEITESGEILEASFSPELGDAIRISESEIGKDRLEFGLSVGGLENVAKWRLGQSLEMERIGYARSGNATQFGNSSEIRIGLNLSNPMDEGVVFHNLGGMFVLGEKWQNAVLNMPLELYGYQAELARTSRLELALIKEGSTEPVTLASIRVKDAYQRKVTAIPGETGDWMCSVVSSSHGKFGVNLFENFRITEGRHRLEATLKDEDSSKPIAAYTSDFVIEDSAPRIVWKRENRKDVLSSQNYSGELSIEDPQTGLASVSVGLGPESMQQIQLRELRGQKKTLKVPFTIEKLSYPEIPAKAEDVRKRVTVLVEATNLIGMKQQLSQEIIIVQQPISMEKGAKTGSLLVKISGSGKYDLVLTGNDGKEKRELPDAQGKAQFDDLPEGNYSLSWKKKYDNSKGMKSIQLKFSQTGEVVNTVL